MITEIDFKVTGEERKKLAYAIGETLGLFIPLEDRIGIIKKVVIIQLVKK